MKACSARARVFPSPNSEIVSSWVLRRSAWSAFPLPIDGLEKSIPAAKRPAALREVSARVLSEVHFQTAILRTPCCTFPAAESEVPGRGAGDRGALTAGKSGQFGFGIWWIGKRTAVWPQAA